MIPESDKCFDMTVVSDSKVKKRIYCLEKPREKWMFISGFKRYIFSQFGGLRGTVESILHSGKWIELLLVFF